MKKTMSSFLATGVAAGLVLVASSVPAVSADIGYGNRDRPLVGQRYQTMLALAGHLDATAQGALEGAIDEARHGRSSQARFLSSIRSFARSAGEFHRMMDDYPATPFAIAPRVSALAEAARAMNVRLRTAAALKSTYDDWGALIDVLGRMTVLLDGGDVEVPTAYLVPALSGASLEQFRRLAQDLDLSATGVRDLARREVSRYPGRGRQFLGELSYFAARTRELLTSVEAGEVDARLIGRDVDRLLEEARQGDRGMRDAQVFTRVWDDSGRTILILQRMASLVRS